MKIKLQIKYNTHWGQTVYVFGIGVSDGGWDESRAIPMSCVSPSVWAVELDTEGIEMLEYSYFVKENERIISTEWGESHMLKIDNGKTFIVNDIWQDTPSQQFFYTSPFTESFFSQNYSQIDYCTNTILINAYCPFVAKNQSLIICGSSGELGNWDDKRSLRLIPVKYGLWQIAIDASKIGTREEYKLAIYDKESQRIVCWEDGENHILTSSFSDEGVVTVKSISFRLNRTNWKAAGVSIPVFSLRTEDSFGIGEFSDLKKMVDWAAITGQKIIQILPINDTTITRSWRDSYPYNAISIYALHPIYLGLNEYPLKDKSLFDKYKSDAVKLNQLESVDYEKVLRLKLSYINDLYKECGNSILGSAEYKSFYKKNEDWLVPYACFCHFRDKNNTAVYSSWKYHSTFDLKKLKGYVSRNAEAKADVSLVCFTQFLLHKQLVEVKEYAHQHQVVLKGDIPIGINRNSVEAWTDPHLFNLDVQTGAPPDDFSRLGQNWGFPTYNWNEMSKDGYQWWIRRFKKMADYFDAYRIDHILGFFRIWEIPQTSVQGILGYFSPALPLSLDEIHSYGVELDVSRMTEPYIHQSFLENLFGSYVNEVVNEYLVPLTNQHYALKEGYNTQQKIKHNFGVCQDGKSRCIRDGLYLLCNEVLFLRDKHDPHMYHPRITVQHSNSFKHLDEETRNAMNNLYEDFFYKRHSQYWGEQAMNKLPVLISSTSMLVCGEDLGMVPDSVPSVMRDLQILSLEIERMPKMWGVEFEHLTDLPYLSVCTTSTHDMSPVRLWWQEDKNVTQRYYNNVLHREGNALADCTSDICEQIIENHLHSPAMLTILPLQDWLAIDDELRSTNPEDERINIPAIPDHYWRYRMHISLEKLIAASQFNERIRTRIKKAER